MYSTATMNFQAWYDENASDLTQAGLWLRGGELNTLPTTEWDNRALHVLWVRLSTYFDTGYSFTHQILYQFAKRIEGVFPDLAYLPPKRDLAFFDRGKVPYLLGTQTKREAREFDAICISNSIVQELLNIPQLFSKSGIPLSKKERLADPDCPLIILGGANALYSSVTWGDDPWVDGVFVGESDAAITQILEILRESKKRGLSKAMRLEALEAVPGFFQPDQPRKTRKAFIPNLNESQALREGPVYYIEEQMGNSHLQISEGCPAFCSFCAESWDRKPYRERKVATLVDVALQMKAEMGLDHIDLYSFNFNMHSGIYGILWELVPYFRGIGLKSQRFDILGHDPQMIEFQHAIQKSSITCGLEGISPRLRKYLHKNLEDDQLHKSLESIFRSKVRELKFFLIATGLEEEQDFIALHDMVEHVMHLRACVGATTRVIFSMTPLVRFPWTPLEFEKAYPMDHFTRIIRKVSDRVRSLDAEFRESADLPEYWVSQVLVRADRPEIQSTLATVLRESGFMYYRDVPESFQRRLSDSLAKKGLPEAKLLSGYTLEESVEKPWVAIDTGVKREFLWEEVERARSFVEIDYCLGRNWTKAKCFHCGGCPTRFHVRDIVLARQERTYTLEQFKTRIRLARESEQEISLRVELGPRAIGVPRKTIGVAVARALMKQSRLLTETYRGYGGAVFDFGENPLFIGGTEVLRLKFQKPGIAELEKLLSDAASLDAVLAELVGWTTHVSVTRELPILKSIEFRTQTGTVQPEKYLKEFGLKHSLRKTGTDVYRAELIPAAIKKGYLDSLESTRSMIRIEPGKKFELEPFLIHAFGARSTQDHSRISGVVTLQ